jgi:hypothetical protein
MQLRGYDKYTDDITITIDKTTIQIKNKWDDFKALVRTYKNTNPQNKLIVPIELKTTWKYTFYDNTDKKFTINQDSKQNDILKQFQSVTGRLFEKVKVKDVLLSTQSLNNNFDKFMKMARLNNQKKPIIQPIIDKDVEDTKQNINIEIIDVRNNLVLTFDKKFNTFDNFNKEFKTAFGSIGFNGVKQFNYNGNVVNNDSYNKFIKAVSDGTITGQNKIIKITIEPEHLIWERQLILIIKDISSTDTFITLDPIKLTNDTKWHGKPSDSPEPLKFIINKRLKDKSFEPYKVDEDIKYNANQTISFSKGVASSDEFSKFINIVLTKQAVSNDNKDTVRIMLNNPNWKSTFTINNNYSLDITNDITINQVNDFIKNFIEEENKKG